MIRHVVLFAWTAEATQAQRQRVADELGTLPPMMSGLRSFKVGPDAGLVEGNFDFAVVADFENPQSYLAYREHPAHQAIVHQFIRPITRTKASVQYEL
jgi:Stress responsive A/B Barrel Domain